MMCVIPKGDRGAAAKPCLSSPDETHLLATMRRAEWHVGRIILQLLVVSKRLCRPAYLLQSSMSGKMVSTLRLCMLSCWPLMAKHDIIIIICHRKAAQQATQQAQSTHHESSLPLCPQTCAVHEQKPTCMQAIYDVFHHDFA